jgi:hypothetical protein
MASLLAGIMLTMLPPIIESQAGTEVGGSIGEKVLREFFLAVGDHYRVPQSEVIIIRERGFGPYEVPIVLYLAKRTHVTPEIIMELRLSGYTWLDITLRFALSPEIFYVPANIELKGPPYAKAYEYYRKKPKKDWKAVLLSDNDVVNLVNLKLMSEYYRCPPEKIIKMKSEGKEFVSINEEIRKEMGKLGVKTFIKNSDFQLMR